MLSLIVNLLAVCVVGFFLANCPCCGASSTGCMVCPGACFGTTTATGTAPPDFTVTLAGFTNGTCTSCASVNATYVAPFIRSEFSGVTGNSVARCIWEYGNAGTACGYVQIRVISQVRTNVQSWHRWIVEVHNTQPFHTWGYAGPETQVTLPDGLPDCEAISLLALPYSYKQGFGNSCVGTAATATITSGVCP